MDRPLELVLSKLESAKGSGGQYRALCPAHDDHHPSLSVKAGSNGRVLLYCHAGCKFDAIVDALGLKPGDLFSDNGHHKPHAFRIVATYDYRNAAGNLLFQVVRRENGVGKNFSQRRPDGAGGWVGNVKGIQPVLYRLPDLLSADPSEWIFIAEGEKSADAVRGLGLLTTTNPGGAGKWHPSYSDTLQGRKVCILPDSDNAGQDHAAKVVSSLKDKAAEVRIVHLPFVTIKSDPFDWIAAGGTKAELLAMLEQAKNVYDIPAYWEGEAVPQTQDYIRALSSLGYSFRMNACNDLVEVNGRAMSDAQRAKIRSQMRDLNYRQVNVMEDAWIAHAWDNSYHPVRDFLDGLKWDGGKHIETLCSYVQDRYGVFHMFLRRWLIGAVARAYEPGSCQNRMLVLDGAQGLGKSYFVRWLASPTGQAELFIEGPVNPDDKDNLIRLITAWIWEVSELGSTMRRSDREAFKYFLSMQQVTVRKPYGRYELAKPALSSFIGTVNNIGGFLDDPTGYRRFMAVHLEAMSWDYSKNIDPAQVWAQAKVLYEAGEPWELTKEEDEKAREMNEEYEVEDPLKDLFLRCYALTGKPADFVATVDIRNTLNGRGWQLHTPRAEAMAIAAMLKSLGVEKGKRGGENGYLGIQRIPLHSVGLD